MLGDYKAGTHLTNPKMPPVLAYKKSKKVDMIFKLPTDICVDGEIELIESRLTIEIAPSIITLSTPKACQPIPVDPAVLKGAKRFNIK